MSDFDIVEPRFRHYVLPNAPLEKLADGFGWLEGPAWFADHDCLIVSDIPNDRLMRWSANSGVTVFRAPSGFTNGNTRDRMGRLVSCSHRHRCIFRTEWDGTVQVLADRFEGKRLNSPNDVVCRSDGSLWFTDPTYGISTDYEGGKQRPELPPSVYRLGEDGRTSACSTLRRPGGNSMPIRGNTSGCSMYEPTRRRARLLGRPASSTRPRPATPTAFVRTRTAISG